MNFVKKHIVLIVLVGMAIGFGALLVERPYTEEKMVAALNTDKPMIGKKFKITVGDTGSNPELKSVVYLAHRDDVVLTTDYDVDGLKPGDTMNGVIVKYYQLFGVWIIDVEPL